MREMLVQPGALKSGFLLVAPLTSTDGYVEHNQLTMHYAMSDLRACSTGVRVLVCGIASSP